MSRWDRFSLSPEGDRAAIKTNMVERANRSVALGRRARAQEPPVRRIRRMRLTMGLDRVPAYYRQAQ
nr:hypothetical protein [Henriciella sp.]